MRLSVLLASALCTLQASASVIEKRAVDQSTYDTLKYYARYAGVTYCVPNVTPVPAGTSRPLACTNCDMAGANITWATVAQPSIGIFNPSGFVAIDNKKKVIVLAWQGTSFKNVQQLVTDATFFTQIPQFQICKNCYASTGIVAAWNMVKSGALGAIKAALRDNPSYPVVILGHSLGGAMTGISSADIQASNPSMNVLTYSYASPRWSNKNLAAWLSAKPAISRITHHKDIIPRIVPTQFAAADYSHIAPEYFISKGPLTPGPGDIQVLGATATSLESAAGNSGPAGAPDLTTNLGDEHTNYIVPVQC